uniref:hypothetical protein n=1 Tax=uncultured Herbaspirillum sp. TaxID=160236 RepID=UPI002582FCCB
MIPDVPPRHRQPTVDAYQRSPDSLSPVISALFGPGLSQHARLITLDSAQPDGLPESLVVERF